MKNFALFIFVMLASLGHAQLCLGDSTFTAMVAYNPGWVYGCATGTSCSGGTEFTNMAICDPFLAIDSCAPAPSCCPSDKGSDLWFSFYAMRDTVTISVIQNTSFVVGIQAFSGGPACGSLSEIGCVVAGGPSGGVALELTGLVVGAQYCYRIYGCTNTLSQQTGVFCFCGSSGLSETALPLQMALQANAAGSAAELTWTATEATTTNRFEVQRSADAVTFATIATVEANPVTASVEYVHRDEYALNGQNYYRVRAIDAEGWSKYSEIVAVKVANVWTFEIAGNPCRDVLEVRAQEPFVGEILGLDGSVMLSSDITVGTNRIAVEELRSGMYLLRHAGNGGVRRFMVMR